MPGRARRRRHHDREIIQRYADMNWTGNGSSSCPSIVPTALRASPSWSSSVPLRIPIHVLLDHVRGNVIQSASHGHRQHNPNQEKRELLALDRELKRLHSAVDDLLMQVNVLPFLHGDIIALS